MGSSKTTLRLDSCGVGVTLEVRGSVAFCELVAKHPFWRGFIPGFSWMSTPKPAAESQWTITESSNLQYDLQSCTIATDERHIVEAIVIVEAYLEQLRQKNGLYTMHGSVVERDGAAVALIGGISGIGKTSVAAAAPQYGWKWISDEKFVIADDGKFCEGVSVPLADEKTRAAVGDAAIARPSRCKVEAYYFPIITAEPKPVVHIYDEKKARWHFYEELSRDIRQVTGVLDGFAAPLPSFDTPELSDKRERFARLLSKRAVMKYYRGPLAGVFDEFSKATQTL